MSSSEGINFWESSLQEISTRAKLSDATVILVGNKGVGKTSLLSGICEPVLNRPRREPMCYDYFNISDAEDLESISKVNVWSFDEKTFPKFADIYMQPFSEDCKVLYMIAVDASSEESVESLLQWIHQTQTQTQKSTSAILNASEGGESIENSQLVIPMIVVACKSDQLRADNIDTLKTAKNIQGQLRAICMRENASLIYTAAPDGNESVNIGVLKTLLTRLLSPLDPVVHSTDDLQIQEGTNNAVIPFGCDSNELILASTEVDAVEFLRSLSSKTIFTAPPSSQGPDEVDGVTSSTGSSNEKLLEVAASLEKEEQEWLSLLKKNTKEKVKAGDVDAALEGGGGSSAESDEVLLNGAGKQRRSSTAPSSSSSGGGDVSGKGRKPGGHESAGDEGKGSNDKAVRGFFENLLTTNPAKKG